MRNRAEILINILISAANHQRQGLLYSYFKEVHKSQDPPIRRIIFLYLVLTTSLYFSGLTLRTLSRLTIFHQVTLFVSLSCHMTPHQSEPPIIPISKESDVPH